MKHIYVVITYLSFLFIYMPSSEAQNVAADGTVVIEVTSKTGRIWMDRNLGASQVATSSTNVASFGYLYQWGRASDGHQLRSSTTSSKLSSQDIPENGMFVLVINSPNDWFSGQSEKLWQGVNGKNNPCPKGLGYPPL